MKKLTTAALAMLIATGTFAQSKYTIKGKINGLPDNTVIEMIPAANGGEDKPVATTKSKDGQFAFSGSLQGPRFFYVKMGNKGYAGFQVMAENADIKVTGDASVSGKDNSLAVNNIVVSGSKSHEQYQKLGENRKGLDALYAKYHTDNQTILDQLEEAGKKKDTVLAKQLQESEAYKKFANDEKMFFDSVGKSINGLILAHKDSWWGPFLLLTEFSFLTPEQRELYDQFSTEAKASYYGKVAGNELYPPSYIGKAAPSLAFVGNDGKPVSYAKLAQGKQFVIIDFWASWCGPCRKAIPGLKTFYDEMKSKGVEIISMSIDKDKAAWQKAEQEENLPWPSFHDSKDVSKAYSVKAIPAMFLLDGNGKVLAENVTLDQIKEHIR